MADSALTSAVICGVWIDADDGAGRTISQYIMSHFNQEVARADLDASFLRNDKKYSKYFVLLSRRSQKDHRFLLFITRVLYNFHYLGRVSNLVLVIVDKKIEEERHMINYLRIFDRVHAVPVSNTSAGTVIEKKDLQNILMKLTERPMKIVDLLPKGNVGIGLAWSYFYGYLNLILPEIPNRIESSKHYSENGKRMSRKFFIIIPESGKTPDQFSDIDQRFITEGPLDEGIMKSRAGKHHLYKNCVHRITGKAQQECLFCGEFATPLLALRKMLDAKQIDERETERQIELFRHTLMAIVNHKRNPECNYKANIVSFADQDNNFSLADQLQKMIFSENEINRGSSSSNRKASTGSSIFYIPVLGIISGQDEDGKRWADGIKNMFEMVSSGRQGKFPESETEAKNIAIKEVKEVAKVEVKEVAKEEVKEVAKEGIKEVVKEEVKKSAVKEFDKFEELHPRKVDLTVVFEDPREKGACEKLIIILSEDFKVEVEEHVDALVAHPIWFPRTTFIVDLGEVPQWLETTGADYIHSRKNDVWTRIFGSLFDEGTSYVEGSEDESRKEETAGGRPYQVDRLPVGKVAEGLAWSYYHNYLVLHGRTIADRIKKTEYFSQGMMPSTLFILLPYSCNCHTTLEAADPAITSADKLETLIFQIAGNNRNYDTEIHKISSQGKTYYACVEYCATVLDMYEMEAEGKAGLSPVQKEVQLFVFQKVLQDIIDSSKYKLLLKLIFYDDPTPMRKSLSDILAENIQKSLRNQKNIDLDL